MTTSQVNSSSRSKTFEAWVEEARELRASLFAAEARLLSFLLDFERSGPWQDAGFSSFDKVLETHRLCSSTKYREFVAASDMLDAGTIAKIGAPAARCAAKIPDQKKRNLYIEAASLRVDDSGFPISEERAREMLQDISPSEKVPDNVRRVRQETSRLAEAENVIRTLKSENAKLRTRVLELEAEVRRKHGKKTPPEARP
jgi:hypothetical protein